MGVLDKAKEIASAIAKKSVAAGKVVAEKTSEAISDGKTAIKINAEEKNVNKLVEKIGEIFVAKIDEGVVFDIPEVAEIYKEIVAVRQKITELKAK